jgi:CheY-like chemotaxis protein
VSEILLVEDTDLDARQAESMLRRFGIKNPIRRLLDGQEAMHLLTKLAEDPNAVPPSIILLDIKLPYVSGFEILEWMKDKPTFSKSLKIVSSTINTFCVVKEAYALGANSFLNKPINFQELSEVIQSFPQHWLVAESSQRHNAAL